MRLRRTTGMRAGHRNGGAPAQTGPEGRFAAEPEFRLELRKNDVPSGIAVNPRSYAPGSFAYAMILVVAWVMYVSSTAGVAGAETAAYDTLEVGAHYTTNTNRNEYHRFWEPGKGLEFYFLTPFHVGYLRSGFRYLSNSGGLEGVPDFQSAYVYAGWSYGVALPWEFRIDPGFSFGVNILHFEDEQISGQEYESEIAGGLSLRVSRPVFHTWRLNVTASSFVMLTHRRVELFFVSAGISRSFSMPGWLRGFLE